MKIYCLMENTTCSDNIKCEHGLSMYIEANGRKILFDTGASGNFLENAKTLGVDLTAVELVVLSHGHNDHGGGLAAFLSVNAKAKIYVAAEAFGKYYNGESKDISIDDGLLESGRFVLVEDRLELGKGLVLTNHNEEKRPYYAGTYGQLALEEGNKVPDRYLHEQYLTIEENGKRIVFSGCSHKGVLNIVTWLKPDILVGGFHFMKLEPEVEQDGRVLKEAAEVLNSSRARLLTCHCTGIKQYHFLKERVGKLEYLAAGKIVEL